jgi:hypothetical protein
MQVLLTSVLTLSVIFMLGSSQSVEATNATSTQSQGNITLVGHGHGGGGHGGGGHHGGGHHGGSHWGHHGGGHGWGHHGGGWYGGYGGWYGVPVYDYGWDNDYGYYDDGGATLCIGPLCISD